MTNDAEVYMQKIKARNFVQNNGQILRTINILHVNYEKLSDVKFAISNVSEHDFLSSVNYLFLSEYILLRHIKTKEPADIADVPYEELEAKHQRALSSSKVRLLITRLRCDCEQKQPQSLRKNRQTAL